MGTFTAQAKFYSIEYYFICAIFIWKNFSCVVLSIITAIVLFPGSPIVFQYMSERVTYQTTIGTRKNLVMNLEN